MRSAGAKPSAAHFAAHKDGGYSEKSLACWLYSAMEMPMPRLLRYFLVSTACVFLASCGTVREARVKDTTRTFTTVVVDAGHGGKDNGAFRRYGGAEKLATLDVATRLARKLRESQFRTVMTRSSDVFVPLDERAAISNRQKNAIF